MIELTMRLKDLATGFDKSVTAQVDEKTMCGPIVEMEMRLAMPMLAALRAAHGWAQPGNSERHSPERPSLQHNRLPAHVQQAVNDGRRQDAEESQ